MTDQVNDQLMSRANEIQGQLEATYGKSVVDQMCGSINRLGVHRDIIARTVASPDAARDFTALGMESLLIEMQAGAPSDAHVRACEQAYASIRNEQRHAARHGRGKR
jgi:hypothetical protein